MGAEAVVIHHPAPMDIDAHRTLGARPDVIAPVIEVGEAAARPADHRHMDLAQGLHHILAIAMDVGDLAVLSHPDAFIETPAQMLGELAIDMAVDFRARLAGVYGDIGDGDLRLSRHSQPRHKRGPQHDPEHGSLSFWPLFWRAMLARL